MASTRRSFLRLLGAAAIGLTLGGFPTRALELPSLAPVEPSLSMRFVQSWDVVSDIRPARIDVLYGFASLNPKFAVRVQPETWHGRLARQFNTFLSSLGLS